MEVGTGRSGYPASQGVYDIQQQLSVNAGYTNILQHDWQVVAGDVVAGELTEPCHSHAEHESVSSGSGLEEHANVEESSQGGHALSFEGFSDFLHFQITDGVVRIAIGMVVCDDGACLFSATFSDEPKGPLALRIRTKSGMKACQRGDSGTNQIPRHTIPGQILGFQSVSTTLLLHSKRSHICSHSGSRHFKLPGIPTLDPYVALEWSVSTSSCNGSSA